MFLPLIAVLIIMLPTFQSGDLEKMESEAKAKAAKAGSRADSIAIMQAFYDEHGEALQKAKEGRLKLGLDLRGGMYVTLEVDIVRLLEETAQKDAVDEIFEQVIEKTREEMLTSEEPTLDVFMRHFNTIAKPQNRSLISYYDIGEISDVTDEKILAKLRQDADDAIARAQEVIRQRIDKYGVSEPNIQLVGNRRIVIELPGVNDEASMRSLLSTTARLEFKLLKNNADIVNTFAKIDKYLANQYKRKAGMSVSEDTVATAAAVDSTKADSTKKAEPAKKDIAKKEDKKADTTKVDTAKTDAAKADTAQKDFSKMSEAEKEKLRKEYMIDHQFTRMFITYWAPNKESQSQMVDYSMPQMPTEGIYSFRIPKDSVAKFEEVLSRKEIQALIPADLQVLLSAKGDETTMDNNKKTSIYEIFCVKKEAELMGDVVTDARKNVDPTTNQWIVEMAMNSDGADKWSRITGANIGKRIAIILDDRVFSAPNVINKISGGRSQITGMANADEANRLEIVLKAGALKAPVKIVEERVVGASLGEDSIKAGVFASLIAGLLVIIYMALYYNRAGLVADYAVIVNVSLVIGALTALQGTLTLPGIAGIILTIGMAVDANVLIYERIREELNKGRTLRAAIDEGYSKALSAIMDSNITTFMTGLILYFFGTGMIQGFALTLMVGIISTLFTAIFITKAIISISLNNGATSYNFGQPKIN